MYLYGNANLGIQKIAAIRILNYLYIYVNKLAYYRGKNATTCDQESERKII